MLLRFAATTQISKAIEHVGAKSNRGFVLLAMGSIVFTMQKAILGDFKGSDCMYCHHIESAKKFGILPQPSITALQLPYRNVEFG